MLREILNEINDEKSAHLEFDFKGKHYKFKVHYSIGRICFSDWKDYEKRAPKNMLKTKADTPFSEYCATPQRMADSLKERGAKNVEVTYKQK